MKTYNLYNDPGHGWLKVERKELVDLGILEKISPYSYQLGDHVYLEEDSDCYTFFKAYEQKHGQKPQTKDCYTNKQSRIRSYESFNPQSRPVSKLTIGSQVSIYNKPYTIERKAIGNSRFWLVRDENGLLFKAKRSQMKHI